MDRIYAEASVTIIAAAGSSSDHGLPGVGAVARRPQRQVQIGDHTMVEMYPDLRQNLSKSPWTTRAWVSSNFEHIFLIDY